MIKRKALELGFTGVGIADARELTEERSRLETWLAHGYHAAMAWMERDPEKRTDPAKLLPGARSVVVGTFNYFTPFEHGRGPGLGKISRYAWGDDYHDVVREKLAGLLEWIKSERPEVQGKICVDTAPMMDKAWAARAGLGWIGKHTNLITPENGSWVFIGEIILDIELEYDAPAADHCGSCTACIEACPTAAIVEPFVVDSNRCISYATIELRDEQLPDELAANLDGWIYGCDICQEVCPWNRFEKPSAEPRFAPRGGETELALDAVEALTPEAYAERFRHSAMKRAKLAGLKRNAAALRTGSAKPADRR
jgi:epoxyqueuosine reductase